MTDLQGGKDEVSREIRLRQAADRLLELLGELLEDLTPGELDVRSVRSISATLKDIRDLQGKTDEDAGKITVVLEGGTEQYAQ